MSMSDYLTYFTYEWSTIKHHSKCDKLQFDISTTLVYRHFSLKLPNFYVIPSLFWEFKGIL